MAAKKTKALAVPKPSGKSMALPSYIKADAPRGTESINAQDVTLPFLRLAQERTPQVVSELIEEGQFFNSVTNETFGETVDIMVLSAVTGQMRFGNYAKGEGILCQAPTGTKALQPNGKTDKGKPTDECASCVYSKWDGDTKPACLRQGKFLVLRPGTSSPMLLVLQSTAFTAARKLNSILLSGGTDTFAHVLRLSHTKGDKAEMLQVSKVGWADEADYHRAEKMYATTHKLLLSRGLPDVGSAD